LANASRLLGAVADRCAIAGGLELEPGKSVDRVGADELGWVNKADDGGDGRCTVVDELCNRVGDDSSFSKSLE
jgi:hypothetical protein